MSIRVFKISVQQSLRHNMIKQTNGIYNLGLSFYINLEVKKITIENVKISREFLKNIKMEI